MPIVEGVSVFEKEALKIGKLVSEKNAAYGDSFGKIGEILKILYPNGIRLEDYKNVLAIVRILDKIFRIATDETAMEEEPWKDLMGYALLMTTQKEDEK